MEYTATYNDEDETGTEKTETHLCRARVAVRDGLNLLQVAERLARKRTAKQTARTEACSEAMSNPPEKIAMFKGGKRDENGLKPQGRAWDAHGRKDLVMLGEDLLRAGAAPPPPPPPPPPLSGDSVLDDRAGAAAVGTAEEAPRGSGEGAASQGGPKGQISREEWEAMSVRKQKEFKIRLVNQNKLFLTNLLAPIIDPILTNKFNLTDAATIAAKLAKALFSAESMNEDEQHAASREDQLNECLRHDDAFAEIESALERHRMEKATDYTDEWFGTDRGNAFRAFYVCMAGGLAYPCRTVTVTSL